MSIKKCQKIADDAKRLSGWVFAHMFNHYFGDGTVVLEKEGPKGKDLCFSATEEWLKLNEVSQFGLTEKDSPKIMRHISSCKEDGCVLALKRLDALVPFFGGKGLPGGSAIALVSVFGSRARGEKTFFSRKNGFGHAIDEIKPFIEWFTNDPDFWVKEK